MVRATRRPLRWIATFATLVGTGGLIAAGWLIAADHRDAPLVTGDAGADIADVYSFVSPENPDNIVLAMTLQGLIPPSESGTSIFDPNVRYEFKIDNDGDAVEDVVIRARVLRRQIRGRQVMHFRIPARSWRPDRDDGGDDDEGDRDDVRPRVWRASVPVSTTPRPIVRSRGNVKLFAGVRDDPFFFDLGQFTAILGGQAGGFNNPGFDSFAGFNAYAIVIEIPSAWLGDNPNLGIWGTTSRRS